MTKSQNVAVQIANANQKLVTNSKLAVVILKDITYTTSIDLLVESDKKILNDAIEVLDKLGLNSRELETLIDSYKVKE